MTGEAGGEGLVSYREHVALKDNLQSQITKLEHNDIEMRAKLMHIPDTVERMRAELSAKLDRLSAPPPQPPATTPAADGLALVLTRAIDALDKQGGRRKGDLGSTINTILGIAGAFALAWMLRG